MIDNNSANNSTKDHHETSHPDSLFSKRARPKGAGRFPFGKSDVSRDPAPPKDIGATISAAPMDGTPAEFLEHLGRHGLGIAYVGGALVAVHIEGARAVALSGIRLPSACRAALEDWGFLGCVAAPKVADANLKRVVNLWVELVARGEPLDMARLSSVAGFLRQLPVEEILDAVRIAAAKVIEDDRSDERFRYFCGICHAKIRARRALRRCLG